VNSSNTIRAMMRVTLVILASFAPSISAAQADATPSPQTRLTLARAVALADAHYPQIRAALEQQIAAHGEIAVARTAYLPRADMLWQTNRATANNIYGLLLPQGVILPISGPVLASDNTRSAWSSAGGTLLSWQPFDFGVRRAQVNAAREGSAAATAGLNLTRLDVESATANAYLDLATAEQLIMTAHANVERLEVFANSVHVLVDNQLRAGADAAQADAQLALARTQFIQAQTNAAVRAAVLADFLGIPSSAIDLDDTQLADSAPPEFADTPAITAHPEARQEAALVNQQQAELTALAHSYAPQFYTQAALSGRGAGTSLTGVFTGGTNGLVPDTLNWAVDVQVTFPAFDIFSIRGRKKVQQANVRTEQARYEQTVDDLSAQVQQAEAQLAGARQIEQNTPIELAAARESESQQRARFKSGLTTVVDVAAAESLLVQAETDDAVARLNTWRSLAAVAAARGDLAPFLAQLAK
jgi:outer membrane protein